MIYYPTCSVTVTSPICSDCPDKELGDIRGFALIHEDKVFTDPTSQSEWNDGINAEEIYVFPYARGGVVPTEHEVAGFGNVSTEVDGYDFVVNAFEPNYVNDWGFWNTIKGSLAYRIAYKTQSRVHIADENCSIIAKAPVAEGEKKEAIIWNIMFKFSQEALLRPYTAPTGIFDRCLALS